jgi:site-specific recombinase XerD
MATFYRDKTYGKIYIEQTVDGKRFRRTTGIKLPADKWDEKNRRAVNSLVMYDGQSVNGTLKVKEMYLTQSIQELTAIGGGMDRLYELYDAKEIGKRTVKPTGAAFMPYLKEYYETLLLDKKSTGLSYQTTYRRLEKFFNGVEPTFGQLDMTFYEKFGRFLEQDCDLSVKTISSQWKNIKHVLGLAYDKKLHTSQDYKKFKRKDEESENIALTQAEVDLIAAAKLIGHLDKVRDYFLIQCYTGAAFADITKVNMNNVTDGICTFRREKSDEVSNFPIHPKVAAILEKYKGNLPPMMSSQKYDKYLKEVCEKAKIAGVFNKRITKGGKKIRTSNQRWKAVSSHCGRRTFATIQVLASTPINLIMLMTGHKTLASFDKYIHLRELQGKQALKDLKWFK